MAFKENRRNKFFEKELEEYLVVAKKNKIDLSTQKGSFAGAIGLTQFMPTNIKAYAVDFDKNGKIDFRITSYNVCYTKLLRLFKRTFCIFNKL